MNEGLHGLAYAIGTYFTGEGEFSHATSFPLPISIAAAFDDALVHDVADAISTETRAYGNSGHSGLNLWTPNVNPFRDPRWGRGSGR
jgi:beta-D-xylosidase 4